MAQKNHAQNPWTAEDERGHTSQNIEWWSIIGFFTSQEDRKHWSLKTSLSEGATDRTHVGSLCYINLFDEEEKRHYVYIVRYPDSRLQSRKDMFDVRHEDSSMKGSYPSYDVHLRDPDNDIDINFTIHAKSLPHWVAQEATNGWLPMGLGVFRYGFIPKTRISGTIKIHGKLFTIDGTGYFEHVWGDFSFRNPLSLRKNHIKTISTYARLIEWWLQNQKPFIPSTLIFSTENNPLGYDWAWTVLDNGWTIFYGNILFCIMGGPATGILILSKDDKTYSEFSNIQFRYNKIKTAKTYDFVYPTELEIIAKKGKETLHLQFTMTQECWEYISRFSSGKHWLGFVICESPGRVEGYYTNGNEKVALTGKCKIEPQRQVSVFGHNSLQIDILKPPKGVGISIKVDSHYLGKKMVTQLRLIPKPTLRFSCRRIENSKPVNQKWLQNDRVD